QELGRTRGEVGGDADAWRSIAEWNEQMGTHLVEALLAPLPGLPEALHVNPLHALRFARIGLSTAAEFSERTFVTEGARQMVPGLALHADLGPDDFTSAAVGMMLA